MFPAPIPSTPSQTVRSGGALLPFAIISRLVGLLLLTAAVLKFTALGVQPVRSSDFLASATSQMVLIVLEIALGAWLLSGRWPIGSWFISLIAFSGFAAVTFRQGWIGQASCGCFGRLSVSPWYTFALEMTRIYTLACWCFACMGISLGIVAMLAVPPDVFADPGSDCSGFPDMASKQQCCKTACLGDPVCLAQCCEVVCNGDPQCAANCAKLNLPCVLCACPKNLAPCFTNVPGDLNCTSGIGNCPGCPCFAGAIITVLCFCD